MSDHNYAATLNAEDFRIYIGSTFQLNATSAQAAGPAVAVELELAEVSGPAGSAPGEFRAPFSLLLHGPLTPIMPQAIYPLKHDKLGLLELFIVPLGPGPSATPDAHAPIAMRYEVVFG